MVIEYHPKAKRKIQKRYELKSDGLKLKSLHGKLSDIDLDSDNFDNYTQALFNKNKSVLLSDSNVSSTVIENRFKKEFKERLKNQLKEVREKKKKFVNTDTILKEIERSEVFTTQKERIQNNFWLNLAKSDNVESVIKKIGTIKNFEIDSGVIQLNKSDYIEYFEDTENKTSGYKLENSDYTMKWVYRRQNGQSFWVLEIYDSNGKKVDEADFG